MAATHRIFTTSVAKVYPYYLAKAGRKGRTRAEVDAVICWLTGYSARQLGQELARETDFETFFRRAPRPNPRRKEITGTICGVRLEAIENTTMREIRYLDKLVDELAKGWPLEKVLRNEKPGSSLGARPRPVPKAARGKTANGKG